MEIEMKVPFKEEDYDRIISKISSDCRANPAGFLKKMDTLYSIGNPEPTGNVVVRLRTEGSLLNSKMKSILLDDTQTYPCAYPETIFTTKIKTITDGGYESNIENEVSICDREEMHNCLRNMGYTAYFNKTKYAFGVIMVVDGRIYHVEIERVTNDISKKSALYVEIENTAKDFNPDAVNSIIETEKSIFRELGLNPDLADKRPWVEILK